MAVATTTALLIGAGIAAGTQVAGAKVASNAAKKAAGQQVAAGEKGQTFLAPYNQVGQQALGQMASMMGLPGITPAAGPPQVAGPGQRLTPPGAPVIGHAMPRPGLGTIGGMAGAAPTASSYAPRTAPPAGSIGQGGVWLRAPTGETIQVDPAQAEHYMQRGAMRVS